MIILWTGDGAKKSRIERTACFTRESAGSNATVVLSKNARLPWISFLPSDDLLADGCVVVRHPWKWQLGATGASLYALDTRAAIRANSDSIYVPTIEYIPTPYFIFQETIVELPCSDTWGSG